MQDGSPPETGLDTADAPTNVPTKMVCSRASNLPSVGQESSLSAFDHLFKN